MTDTTYANAAAGLVGSSVEDPGGLNLTTATAYEAPGAGFLRRVSRTLPAGGATTYAYYGNAQSRANPCNTASSANQRGRLKTTTAPDPDGAGPQSSRVTEQVYDGAGRVVASRVGSEAWACTTYDARGRPTSRSLPASATEPARTVTYNYAVGGNPLQTSVADPAGTITTTVDLLGRVVSYTDAVGNTTSTTYDQPGRATRSTGPGLGWSAETDYDPAGRPVTQRLDGATVARGSYDGAGDLASATYPANGTSLSAVGRDQAGRLTGLTWSGPGGTLATDTVGRSRSGRVTDETIDNADANPGQANFRYDGAGRLTQAWVAGHALTYSYADAPSCPAPGAGRNTNRTSVTDNSGPPTTYCYDAADRLTSSSDPGVGAPSYDAHGNTTSLGDQTLLYDGADRHVRTQVAGAGEPVVRYVRDATDRIVTREVTTNALIALRGATSAKSGTGATSVSIPVPAGTQTGDLLVAQVTATGTTLPTVGAPAGWTTLDSATAGSGLRQGVYWRVAGASEPASYSWTLGAASVAAGGMGAYSGVNTASPVATFTKGTGTGTAMTAPSFTTSTSGTKLLGLFGPAANTVVSAAAGMVERWQLANGGLLSSATAETADADLPGAGASGARTATSAAAADWVAHLLALNPARVTTTTRYGYSGPGDSPDVVDYGVGLLGRARQVSLLGGVLVTKGGPRGTATATPTCTATSWPWPTGRGQGGRHLQLRPLRQGPGHGP